MSHAPGGEAKPQRAFQSFVRPRFHEVDRLGHVNNAAYLNYLEQAAIEHANAMGLDWGTLRERGGFFLARRHEIDYLRPAFEGELLRVVTWLDEPRGARVARHYRVARTTSADMGRILGGPVDAGDWPPEEQLVARARTDWVYASLDGRPRRIPAEILKAFGSGDAFPKGD